MNTAAAQDWKSKEAARAFAAQQIQAVNPHLVPNTGNALVTAAKNIRIELHRAFPAVKFTVQTKRFSGGNDINVRWTDGPTAAQVDAIIGRYQAGDFDGMTDSYNYERSAWRDAFGQSKYIFSNRDYSDKAVASCIRTVGNRYAGNLKVAVLPTVADWRSGRAFAFKVDGLGGFGNNDIQSLTNRELARRTWAI